MLSAVDLHYLQEFSSSWNGRPFGQNRHGSKSWGLQCPFPWGIWVHTAVVSCAIILAPVDRRALEIIACNNFSAWFHVQLFHANFILGSGPGYSCHSVCDVTSKMSADVW